MKKTLKTLRTHKSNVIKVSWCVNNCLWSA